MKKDTSWGQVADWYFEHLLGEDSYHNKVILPNLLRLMDIRKGDRILDIACGTGFFSAAFQAAGADVAGCDVSGKLVEIAKKNTPPQIAYHVTPANKLDFAENNYFSKTVIVLAIQNIQETKEVFSEIGRVLKPGGSFFLVMNHPAFRIPKASGWEWDKESGKQYRRIDKYLSESKNLIDMHPGSDNSQTTVSFHRPLQYYFKLLHSAGFEVCRLEEWISHKKSEAGPRQAEEDRMRKEIPLFLFLEARKGA